MPCFSMRKAANCTLKGRLLEDKRRPLGNVLTVNGLWKECGVRGGSCLMSVYAEGVHTVGVGVADGEAVQTAYCFYESEAEAG